MSLFEEIQDVFFSDKCQLEEHREVYRLQDIQTVAYSPSLFPVSFPERRAVYNLQFHRNTAKAQSLPLNAELNSAI